MKAGFRENLHAVFCLAENAVGPKAQRPDDVVTMYSGKTVEVNNTDAEGRLVLGDGVAFAKKDLQVCLLDCMRMVVVVVVVIGLVVVVVYRLIVMLLSLG